MSADFFLAWKYFKPKRSAVSVITLISVIGVALGVGVLIVVLAVMTGFTDKMKEKLVDTTSHAQVYGYAGAIANPEEVVKKVEELGGSAVPIVASPVLLQVGEKFIPKQLVAFDPEQDRGNVKLEEALLDGTGLKLGRNEIVISYLTARDLQVGIGDKILLHSPSHLAGLVKRDKNGKLELSSEAYLPGEYKVTGIFSFGKYDFDRDVIFLNLEDADARAASRRRDQCLSLDRRSVPHERFHAESQG